MRVASPRQRQGRKNKNEGFREMRVASFRQRQGRKNNRTTVKNRSSETKIEIH